MQPTALAACVPGGGHDHYPFCNRTLALEERVADLVRRIPNYSKAKLLTARARAALPSLGVPAFYYGHNCMWSSGIKACSSEGRCSTSFPAGPNAAAAFDRRLWRQVAATMGREVRAWYNAGGGGLSSSSARSLDDRECWSFSRVRAFLLSWASAAAKSRPPTP